MSLCLQACGCRTVPLATASGTLYIVLVVINHNTTYWQQHQSRFLCIRMLSSHLQLAMRKSNMVMSELEPLVSWIHVNTGDYPVDNTYLWFIIPQLLNGPLLPACFHESIRVHLCPGSHAPPRGCSLVCGMPPFSIRYLVVDVLEFIYHWEKVHGWSVRERRGFWSWCPWCCSRVCPDTTAIDSEMR